MTRPAYPARFLIRGGQLLDGTGRDAVPADIVVSDGEIAEVRPPGVADGGLPHVDVDGLTVAPGFIDLHTHCDFTIPRFPRADSMVRQGVTTVLVGNCGHSTFPVGAGGRRELMKRYSAFLAKDLDWRWSSAADYVELLQRLPLAVNVALQVGHGTVRVAVMGFEARAPDEAELAAMQREVAAAMEAGALGFSSGLIYPPGTYAETDELVALAAVAARYGGFYSTHMRNEGPALLDSVREALQIAETAGLPLEVSHHKVLGRVNWGLTKSSLELIDAARERGVDVTADQYPYEASSTTLAALLPSWVMEGGVEAMRRHLGDPAYRARVVDEILHGPRDGRPHRQFEPETVLVADVPGEAAVRLVGHRLSDLAESSDRPAVEVMLDLLQEHGGGVEVVIFAIGEEDIRRVMRYPHVAVASDGWTLHPSDGGTPHPRSYGTFSRVLGHYVREEGVLSLPEAVRKMTSLPARRLGLPGLGVIEPGARADLVAFDPGTVRDRATYTQPHQFCAGVSHVFVNGVPVISEGADTGLPAGHVLRRPQR